MANAMEIPETELNSGHKMPMVGFGCACSEYPIPPSEELAPTFLEAIKSGYRNFDTATLYGTEEPLGKAVSQAIETGLVKGREEFFISTKLWCGDADHDLVLPVLKRSLGKLGLDYVDLFLIHWPLRMKEHTLEVIPFDMHGTWKAMEECNRLGLTKSIGVSNFTSEKLSKLLEKATIIPAVNQVEMNVSWQQRKLFPFCQKKGIHVTASSPLGSYGTAWGCNIVMENPVVNRIAASRNKTVPQIALRWIHEQGASVIVKSFNKERMIQNLQIFDFQLTKEELEQIHGIPQRRCSPGDAFVNPQGMIKSLEQLWDGDV